MTPKERLLAAVTLLPNDRVPTAFHNSAVVAEISGLPYHDYFRSAEAMLNETGHKELLAHATAALPLVRSLDPTRLVILNSGGGSHSMMSNPHTDYRDLISAEGFTGLEPPEEAVCGAVRLSGGSLQRDYAFGLHISVHRLGAGRFILNNLHIRENLGKVPAAERLLRNLLRYAASPQRTP